MSEWCPLVSLLLLPTDWQLFILVISSLSERVVSLAIVCQLFAG